MTQCSDLDKRSLELIAFDEDFRGALQGTLGSPPQAPARCRRGGMIASGMMEPDVTATVQNRGFRGLIAVCESLNSRCASLPPATIRARWSPTLPARGDES
jgi:hypothetical protein